MDELFFLIRLYNKNKMDHKNKLETLVNLKKNKSSLFFTKLVRIHKGMEENTEVFVKVRPKLERASAHYSIP